MRRFARLLAPVEALVLLAAVGIAGTLGGCSQDRPEELAHDDSPTAEHGPEAAMPGVEIDPRRQQLIGVTYGTVEQRDVQQRIRTVGTVEYDESRLTDISLKFDGWIEELHVDETGFLVQRDQVLLELYSPDLVSTQQEYLTAFDHHQRLKGSGNPDAVQATQRLVDASAQRLAYWDINPKHVRDLETSRTVLRALPIHSPESGYVIEKNVVAGTFMRAGHLLYRLANLDVVWVLADIYEYELPMVSVGQEVEVSLAYLPGERFAGRVSYIYPYLEASERTVKVRIRLANPSHRLKQGMYADVVLARDRAGVRVVPRSAVLDSGTRQVVFVALEEGRFEPRPVTLGAQFDEYYEVLAGVEVGERIVTSGNFLLDSESQLVSGVGQMEH